MEGLELICFQIISAAGGARSNYIEAIDAAKEGNFVKAKELISEGEKMFSEGHSIHTKLIQQSASDDQEAVKVNMLLVHSEDMLMSAETFGILAKEFIELYKKIK